MSYNDWEAFWLKRGKMKFSEMKPFLHNFYVMHEMLTNHFGADLNGLNSLEVGAGRGTISHYLKNFGINVKCMDLVDKVAYQNIPFIEGDVFKMPYRDEIFDIVFTYGLLEHFNMEQQVEALNKMLDVTVYNGINIHYIVPRKMTNIFEDRNVKRDLCFFIRQEFPLIWTYPVHNMGSWKTNKWFGKGAFFKLEKKHEATGVSNCQVNEQACTVQKQTDFRKEAII